MSDDAHATASACCPATASAPRSPPRPSRCSTRSASASASTFDVRARRCSAGPPSTRPARRCPTRRSTRRARADAVLLAAIGGPKWDTTDPDKPRPEQGLLGIRKALGLYANLRPVRIFDAAARTPRTLQARVPRGRRHAHRPRADRRPVLRRAGARDATCRARRRRRAGHARLRHDGLPRVRDRAHRAHRRSRRRARAAASVHSVDKANVLETSRLWREVVHRVHAPSTPTSSCSTMLVDNAAMQLIREPAQFDVMVTENMFGDILSDEASMLTGSLGMLASASLGDGTALYEPSHGSAPGHRRAGRRQPARDAAVRRADAALQLRHARRGRRARRARSTRVLDDGYRTRGHRGRAATTRRRHGRDGRPGGRAAVDWLGRRAVR